MSRDFCRKVPEACKLRSRNVSRWLADCRLRIEYLRGRIKSRDMCQACQGVRYFRAFVHKHQMLGVVDEVEGLVAYECSWSCEHSIDVFIHLASLLRLSSFPPPKSIHRSTQTESNVRVRFIIDCQEAVMTTRHTTKVHMLISA
jgi:hypothetical protein